MNKFKKLFAVLGLTAVFAVNAATVKAVDTQVGIVQGLVYKSGDSTPANGANVSVSCNSQVLNTTADASGFYFVQYPSGVCNAGDTATVTATKDGQSGSNTGVLANSGQFGFLRLDLAVVHVALIPEFGVVTGAMALISSAGAFTYLRRKTA